MNRLVQPLLESRIIWMIDANASISDGMKFIDKISPEAI